MLRIRFVATDGDPRPIKWPVKHPYWCTGYTNEDKPIMVAYADSKEQILEFWPDAEQLDVMSTEDEYTFTSRFPRPDWMR